MEILAGIASIASPLLGSGGLIDDLFTTDEERDRAKADIAKAEAARDVARIRAENNQRLAMYGLVGLGVVVLGGVAIAALKD